MTEVLRRANTVCRWEHSMIYSNREVGNMNKVRYSLMTVLKDGRRTIRRGEVVTLEEGETVEHFIETFAWTLKQSLLDKYGEEFVEYYRILNIREVMSGRLVKTGIDIKRDTP